MNTVQFVIGLLLRLYSLVLLGRVLSTWLDPHGFHPVSRILIRVTEPVLAPLRRRLPQAGPFDLSPVVAFLALEVLALLVESL